MKLKNITPRQIALYTGLGINVIQGVMLYIFWYFNGREINSWFPFIVWFLISFLITYMLLLLVIRWFIFRKVKLIYKSIREFKTDRIHKTTRRLQVRRVDLEPATCGDPSCDADHGLTGSLTPDDVVVRVSSQAEGAQAVADALEFARALSAATAAAR